MATKSQTDPCSNLPSVLLEYEEQGQFVNIGGLRTYVTGSSNATLALIVIYDALGFSPLNIRGADILTAPKSPHHLRVYMPDVLEGHLADPSWYPPETPYDEDINSQHFGPEGPVKVPRIIEHVHHLQTMLSRRFRAFAIMGHGWGANIATLASFQNSPFKAAILADPYQSEPSNAARVSIPICILTSKDTDLELVQTFENALQVPSLVKTCGDAEPGWMSLETDLGCPKALDEYNKGYCTILNFLHDHL